MSLAVIRRALMLHETWFGILCNPDDEACNVLRCHILSVQQHACVLLDIALLSRLLSESVCLSYMLVM